VLALYETVAEPLPEAVVRAAAESDYITFASSSTVRLFFDALGAEGALASSTRIVSIGPVTSAALRERGIEPHAEAERHDAEGLLEALLADATARRAAAIAGQRRR
jgi:uroporphyrinogen III methyltransferase / synthase